MGFWLFSGIDGELGWKTVPPTERSIRVNPINPCSKKTRRLNEHGFIGFNGFYKWWSAVWKTVPSVSESNPGRCLGIYNQGENCCLEDSTSHRAKHPRQSDKSVFEKNREVKRTRIIRIQRILSGGDNRSPSGASASIRKIRVR